MSSLTSQSTHRSRPLRSISAECSNRGAAMPRREETTTRMPPCLGQLNPEQRKQVYTEVLESNRSFLCSHLDPGRHFTYLRSRRHFDVSTVEIINHNVTSVAKVNSFIDELLKKGPDAVSAFLESLQISRVENFVFSRLADACQTFPFQNLSNPGVNPCNGSLDYVPDDDDNVDANESRLSGQFELMSVSGGGRPLAVVADAEANNAVMPPVDYNRLLEAQGLHVNDREPEEVSDMSSVDCLTSHGN